MSGRLPGSVVHCNNKSSDSFESGVKPATRHPSQSWRGGGVTSDDSFVGIGIGSAGVSSSPGNDDLRVGDKLLISDVKERRSPSGQEEFVNLRGLLVQIQNGLASVQYNSVT